MKRIISSLGRCAVCAPQRACTRPELGVTALYLLLTSQSCLRTACDTYPTALWVQNHKRMTINARAGNKAAAGSGSGAWFNLPTMTGVPAWLPAWLALSGLIVIYDASYCLLRPRSMPGGDLFHVFKPYKLYGEADQLYGTLGWKHNDGFCSAQVWPGTHLRAERRCCTLSRCSSLAALEPLQQMKYQLSTVLVKAGCHEPGGGGAAVHDLGVVAPR